MTDRDAEQEAREIVSLYVHNHGRHGEPLSCPSCKKLCVIIAAALQRRDDALAQVRHAKEMAEGMNARQAADIERLLAERDALKAQHEVTQESISRALVRIKDSLNGAGAGPLYEAIDILTRSPGQDLCHVGAAAREGGDTAHQLAEAQREIERLRAKLDEHGVGECEKAYSSLLTVYQQAEAQARETQSATRELERLRAENALLQRTLETYWK